MGHLTLMLKIKYIQMKKITLTIVLIIISIISGYASGGNDTTITINNRIIELNDIDNKLKVKVFEITENGSEEKQMIFEGHYRDGVSHETRNHRKQIVLSVPTWNKNYEAHWAGFGIGFANISSSDFSINTVDGVSLQSDKSLEYNLKIFDKAFPFSSKGWAFVSGFGLKWSRYRLDNMYLQEVEGITCAMPSTPDMQISKSKLNINSFVIPFLLEWQKRYRRDDYFFFNAGAEASIKFSSASRITYYDAEGNKHKQKVGSSLNLLPITMDFIAQTGYGNFGFYARYSPFSMFEKNKGPEIHPCALGMQLYF